MNVGTEWNDPPRKGDNRTVECLFIECTHDLGYVASNAGVVAIKSNSLEIFCRGGGVEISRTANGKDAANL